MKKIAAVVVSLAMSLLIFGCSAQTDPATDVTSSSATLNGRFSFKPSERGTVWWEYSKNGGTTWTQTAPGGWGAPTAPCNGSGTESAVYSIPPTGITGLTPGSHYIFRLAATNCGQGPFYAEANGVYTSGAHNYDSFDTPLADVKAYGSLATIRQGGLPAGGSSSVSISAAKNEYESFQIGVKTPSGYPMNSINFSWATPPTGPSGAIPSSDANQDLVIYREADYNVNTRSDQDPGGGTGKFPDALIPKRDYLYHENRSGSFPYSLSGSAGSDTVAAWFDVLAPPNYASGNYTGSVVVTSNGTTIATVPVTVHIFNFGIPSTTKLKTAFPLSSYKACDAFYGVSDCGNLSIAWSLTADVARMDLSNRITLFNPEPSIYGEAGDPTAPLSGSARTNFDSKILPLLNGSGSNIPLAGAALTTTGALWGCSGNTVHPSTSCLSNWQTLASADGFTNKFIFYNCDEPDQGGTHTWTSTSFDTYHRCADIASRANSQWSNVPKLITTQMTDHHRSTGASQNSATGYTDIIATAINLIDEKDSVPPGSPATGTNRRPDYNTWLSSNQSETAPNEVWLYNACSSHETCTNGTVGTACGAHPAACWPSFAIDESGWRSRAMGWEDYLYGATGQLYFDQGVKLRTAWSDQYSSGSNGDGTLFYPGIPAGDSSIQAPAIGGSTKIPIESIRLKRIRDGVEDYEYLLAAQAAGQGSSATSIAQSLFGWESTPGGPCDAGGSLSYDGWTVNSCRATQAGVDSARSLLAALIP